MCQSLKWKRLVARVSAGLMVVTTLSCGGGEPTGPVAEPMAAKGHVATVTVQQADPAAGSQGVVNLRVRIFGSGFSKGAVADWERNGVADPAITVSSTQYVSSTEVDATVSIAADAEVASYDVAVTSGGKKGIGTELFAVTLADPTATWFVPVGDASVAFQGDHADTVLAVNGGPATSYARYRDGECGVSATIFATVSGSTTGDATILPSVSGRKGCSRRFTFVYPDQSSEMVRSFNNLRELQNGLFAIPPGQTINRRLIVAPDALSHNPSRCGRLLFGQNDGPNGLVGVGSDSVSVTRLNSVTWLVQSQPGRVKATCENTGEILDMPVRFLVESSRPL